MSRLGYSECSGATGTPEDRAKLERLRGAVRESIEELDRGEGVVFDSPDEVDDYIDRLAEQASARARRGRS